MISPDVVVLGMYFLLLMLALFSILRWLSIAGVGMVLTIQLKGIYG